MPPVRREGLGEPLGAEVMRTSRRNFIAGVLSIAVALLTVAAGLRAQDATRDSSAASSAAGSAALFRTYCATCHEGPGANPQAPGLDVMKRMSAEQVLESLERGAMRVRAAERSRAQRRALAEYVSGKSLAAEAGGPMPKSAFCSATPNSPPATLAEPA
jgi:mono/diheme cytochrome c family protein